MVTECCHRAIADDERFCPRCGWEARVQDDNYIAWLRWAGDTLHRRLVLCDSDSEGAFKVYRRTRTPQADKEEK